MIGKYMRLYKGDFLRSTNTQLRVRGVKVFDTIWEVVESVAWYDHGQPGTRRVIARPISPGFPTDTLWHFPLDGKIVKVEI